MTDLAFTRTVGPVLPSIGPTHRSDMDEQYPRRIAAPALLPALAIAVVTLVACGGGKSPQVTSESTSSTKATDTDVPTTNRTIVVSGVAYSCGEMIDAPPSGCDEFYQPAFNRWGDKLDAYVHSGQLGPLAGDIRYQDVAASGLAACAIADRGDSEQQFVDFMRKFYPDADSVEFLPLWFGALERICPDVGSGAAGDGNVSHDRIIP